ncbi:hypothetical protein OSB04_001307 [Centaurea solstitialis]|uniref:Reverse transcriptase zinc-binding domain-containing protein n=1 Tax=Centaurea solstitialis TaxID=347529 RepID=A0AA38WUW1_9ASTR|nr:hypothetical protein OSB04_001307 [Centaurea solstitialis]
MSVLWYPTISPVRVSGRSAKVISCVVKISLAQRGEETTTVDTSRVVNTLAVRIFVLTPQDHDVVLYLFYQQSGAALRVCRRCRRTGPPAAEGLRKDIMIWMDDTFREWIASLLSALDIDINCSLADRVTVTDGISIFRGCWRRTIRPGREINEVAAIEIVCRNLHLGTEESVWTWALTDTGLFSVSSLRYAIDDMLLRRCGAPTLWSKLVPLKIRIHVWRVRLDRLPTKANLLEKGLNLDTDTCLLCNDSGETGDHLFITCRTAVEVRRRINVWWNCLPSLCNSVRDFFEEISSKNQPDSQRLLKEAIGQAYVWAMWKGRNDLLFNNKAFNILVTANWIQSAVFLWCNSRIVGGNWYKIGMSIDELVKIGKVT